MAENKKMLHESESADIIIAVKKVNKIFRDQIVLQDINLTFERNKIHGIVGRNGSGKTVLLKGICGLMPMTSGEIMVNDMVIGSDVDFAPDTGFIIEAPGFLVNYSGYKNLKYLAAIRDKISGERIRECMRMVGLDPDSRKHVGKYSLGMRQRLGIAQAFMEDPEVLILDEPLNSLDNRGVEEMHILFKELRDRGKTILLTSHNMYDIEDLCDTVTELDGGRIISETITNHTKILED